MNGTHAARWLLALGLAGPVAAGCGGSKQEPGTDFDARPWEVRVESPLDTTVYTGGTDEADAEAPTPAFPEAVDPAAAAAPVVVETPGTAQAVPDPETFTPGWRVQIFASSSMVNADELARKARGVFTEPVYVEYEPPLYKVRVGDFLAKDDARHMMNRAKAENFDAWIVESLVVKPTR
jgi:cell division septation protein DedD